MPIRLGGLQSGMDTESLVQVMLDSALQPVTRQEEKIVKLEDDLYGWSAIDSALTELGSISNDLSSFSAWAQKTTSSTDADKITATAVSTAVAGSYSIEISQLAVAHAAIANSLDTITTGDLATIDDADDELDAASVGDKFTINGEEIEIEEGDTLRDIAMKINVASASLSNSAVTEFKALIVDKTLILQSSDEGIGNGLDLNDTTGNFLEDIGVLQASASPAHINNGNTISPDSISTQHKVSGGSIIALGINDVTTALDMAGTFTVGDGTNTFSVTTTATTTLTELKDDINAQALLGAPGAAAVSASIVDNELVFTSTSAAFDETMTFTDDTGSVLEDLNLLSRINVANESDPANLEGEINGITVTATSNSGVSTLINGVNLTFIDETTVGTPVIVTVKNETEDIKTTLLEFIDKYNDVMALADSLGTVQLSDNGELTAAGILQGEFLITEIQTNARTILTQVNTGFFGTTFNSLDDIGVYTDGQANELKLLDEDLLDDSLANHFDDIKNLFRDVEYDDDGVILNSGIMRGFDDYVNNLIKPLTGRISLKTDTINDDISDRQAWIVRKQNALSNYENSLWESFAAMESAMAGIQSGGAFMLQQLGMS